MGQWDIEAVRAAFPALALRDGGQPRVYLDAPAGTQVAGRVIEAMRRAMIEACANDGGAFRTSQAAGAIAQASLEAAAAFYNCAADEIVLGLNTTSLFFAMADLLSRDWRQGDEIVLSQMDHDANVAPWLLAAKSRGVTVRWLEIDPDTFEYRYEQLATLIGPRTRLVACNHASNLFGTVSDVGRICAAARAVGAVTVVDAVQSAPHLAIDVAAIGCDLLCASAYKFFGPHAAVMFVARGLQDRLPAYKVRPSPDTMPWKLSPGTPSFEAQAGTLAAIEHFAWLGSAFGDARDDAPLRQRIVAGLGACAAYEAPLARRFLEGAAAIPGLRLYGLGGNRLADRVATFSFTLDGRHSPAVVEALAARNIFAWAGYFYAHEPAERLGLRANGGAVRVGLTHYTTAQEVDLLLAALDGAARD